jgi:hypothetical protein
VKPAGTFLVLALAFLSVFLPVHGAGGKSQSALRTVDGTVVAIDLAPGEGGVEILRVSLEEEPGSGPLSFLLAPAEALESIGFEVQVGDRLKLKCFYEESGPARVHKMMNVSRGSMIRLRTLRQIPLWDNRGLWQGGPSIMRPDRGSSGGVRG